MDASGNYIPYVCMVHVDRVNGQRDVRVPYECMRGMFCSAISNRGHALNDGKWQTRRPWRNPDCERCLWLVGFVGAMVHLTATFVGLCLQRTGGYHKYIDYGTNLTAQDPSSVGFMSGLAPSMPRVTVLPRLTSLASAEADRFHTDTAGEEKLARDARVERRHDQYIQKRAVVSTALWSIAFLRYSLPRLQNVALCQNAEREDERWARIEREKAIEEAKWQEIRDKGEKARRNHNSVPYNPLTLAYNQSEEGNRLRHADDLIRWRAAQRAKNLQVHAQPNHTTCCMPRLL